MDRVSLLYVVSATCLLLTSACTYDLIDAPIPLEVEDAPTGEPVKTGADLPAPEIEPADRRALYGVWEDAGR